MPTKPFPIAEHSFFDPLSPAGLEPHIFCTPLLRVPFPYSYLGELRSIFTLFEQSSGSPE